MPEYTFRKRDDHKDIFVLEMTMAAREDYIKNNPDVEQIVGKPPAIGDSIRLGLRKPDDGFRDMLRRVKEHHPGGGSAINTF